MASRMQVRGVRGCVVGGRVRDLAELKSSGLPVWASGRSTVGVGAEAKVYARNVTISIKDVSISPGDIVFCDPLEGVVVIPQALVDQVVDLIPKLVSADDKVKEDVEAGSTVQTAFKKHRG
ncbi:hypothetical protein LTR70_002977 [Exophiala xenobiotica]|uniref:Uncharacterized protein n=1 Tax=Lithohypha guttulata TaxID=1690604 RepID=A0ABR0K7C7_9EURO|nr:hypothetical protein LTR24_006530 [Lithohypha guttulata]KAK5324347.1 hypothetical protein LTR70_002977 [Exophiala xenobiotica]